MCLSAASKNTSGGACSSLANDQHKIATDWLSNFSSRGAHSIAIAFSKSLGQTLSRAHAQAMFERACTPFFLHFGALSFPTHTHCAQISYDEEGSHWFLRNCNILCGLELKHIESVRLQLCHNVWACPLSIDFSRRSNLLSSRQVRQLLNDGF
jgi:hypothetical protein